MVLEGTVKRSAGAARLRGLVRAPLAPALPSDDRIDVDPDLWGAVTALPDRGRQVVALRYVMDYSQIDIANVLGIAPGTVSTLNGARRKLHVALSPAARSNNTGRS